MERSKPLIKSKGLYWVGYPQSFNKPQMRYGPWETPEEILKDGSLRFYRNDFIYKTEKNKYLIIYRYRENHRWQKLFNPIYYDQK